MVTIAKDYLAKLTKDWLLTDSTQEMNRIDNIVRVILNTKNSI